MKLALISCIFLFLLNSVLAGFSRIDIPRPNPGTGVIGLPSTIDYNGDGVNDIIVHTQTSNGGQFHVILNNGAYTFATQLLHTYTTTTFYHQFCVADFDNDRDIDIVRVNVLQGNTIQIVLQENQGGNVFVQRPISGNLTDFIALACQDINSDGKMDVLASIFSTQILAFTNQGNWAFNTLTLNTYAYCLPPAFIPGKISTLSYPNVLYYACWNGDVGYISYDGSNIKTTLFTGGNYNALALGVADFNADGYPDVVASGGTCWNSNIYVYNAATRFYDIRNIPVSYSCYTRSYVSAGDLDGNKYGDIIIAGEREVKVVWYSASGPVVEILGSFSSNSFYYNYPIFAPAKLYDNAIGNQDLILHNGGDYISVYTTCKACASCPAGSFVTDNGSCVACPDSHTSLAGSKSCYRVCSAGFAGSYPSCSECPVGSYSTQGATTCTKCSCNQVSIGGSNVCKTCSANTYPVASTYCRACPLGTSAEAGSTSCTPCPFGTVRGHNDATCVACPAGTYADVHTCTPCSPGSYSSTAQSASCTKCASGSVAGQGATACTACPTGYLASSTNSFCYLP